MVAPNSTMGAEGETAPTEADLGCSIDEFVGGGVAGIPPLARYVGELAGFSAACGAAAQAARRKPRGVGAALRRQAARDSDVLLLAEWWNELMEEYDALVALLFAARAEVRSNTPSHSVLRAQVHQAAQKYLTVAQDARAAAHAEFLAVQRQTDGPRISVLDTVVDAAAANSNVSCTMRPVTWFGVFERDLCRGNQPVRLAETSRLADDGQAGDCQLDVGGDSQDSVPVSDLHEVVKPDAQPATAFRTAEEDEITQQVDENDDGYNWVPLADMNSLPKHTTLDPQQRVVPTVTAYDMQANPPMFTVKAAPPVVDEVGAVHPSVRGEPIAYVEELAEPPRQGRHTDRLALRQCQDYWDRANGDEQCGGSVDHLRSGAEDKHDSCDQDGEVGREGDCLTVPAFARATLLDC